MKVFSRTFLLVAVLAVLTRAASAQVLTKTTVSLELAKKIAATAEAEAARHSWPMFIVILDDGGNLVYLERMDGAQLGSLAVAEQKARTALLFKRPTKVYEDAVAGGKNTILSVPNVIAIEGGIPLVKDGAIIGAIGASGMQPNQDGAVAQAGANVVSALDAGATKR